MKLRAFVLGNGPTRRTVSVDSLKPFGTVYGCNAIYREENPDYVIAIDDGMIKELRSSKFPQHRIITPIMIERWEPFELHPNGNPPRSNAGMNALIEAYKRDYDEIYVIGFDFLLDDLDHQSGNLYDGSPNYTSNTRAKAEESAARLRYLEFMINVLYSERKPTNVNIVFPAELHSKRIPVRSKKTYAMSLETMWDMLRK